MSPAREDAMKITAKRIRMSFRQFRFLVRSDLYRYSGRTGSGSFIRGSFVFPGFRYTFLLRTCAYLDEHPVFRYGILQIMRLIKLHYTYKFGIEISHHTKIGSGLYIGHFGGIGVHPGAVIGKNCNLSQLVRISQSNRGERKGCPIIGDNVYIAPGAKIIGSIRVGNNVAIGSNCVVVDDVPDGAVVVGVPGRIVSNKGSDGYIEFTDYPELDSAN